MGCFTAGAGFVALAASRGLRVHLKKNLVSSCSKVGLNQTAQVDGDRIKFLKLIFTCLISGNYLLVAAQQHQWVVELSLKFTQLNLGMAKMVR